ncbi:glycosyltransferase family 2 protein [Alkalithermobacter paradoxus]|uniref:Chondroitin synthase n=1 Tax=Alkalithermobacter paradoxus TaxID=29349 RepID=A0A1V4I9G9_9FIRM|nr:chondroitin synthase [[Clostridium] thermoalcaliphilum]
MYDYVSVIIPSFNACERLYLALEGYKNQSFDHNKFEVIIVDDGSSDNTLRMIEEISCNFKLKVIDCRINVGRSYARNEGIIASSGDILIFSDADMIPIRDFIKNHVESHNAKDMVVVGPITYRIFSYYYTRFDIEHKRTYNSMKYKYKNYSQISKYNDLAKQLIFEDEIYNNRFLEYIYPMRYLSKWYEEILDIYGKDFRNFYFPWIFLCSGNFSVSKKNIIDIGMFDESFRGWGAEDWELGYRLYKKGLKYIYNPDALSIHQEHPHDSQINAISARKNSVYMTQKHSDFNVILFYFASHLGYNFINQAVKEYDILSEKQEYKDLISMIDRFVKNYFYEMAKLHNVDESWGRRDKAILNQNIYILQEIYGRDSCLLQLILDLQN